MKAAAGTAVSMCALVCLLMGCSSKSDDSSGAKKKGAATVHEAKGQVQSSGVEDDLADVFFISRATLPHGAKLPPPPKDAPPKPLHDVGFIVGKANTVLKTADGGKTWRRLLKQKADGPAFDRVLFVSPTKGWVGNRGLLLHTPDGGDSWSAASGLSGIVNYFGPYTATAAFYYQMKPPTCGAVVLRTTNGMKWIALEAGLPRNDYQAVCFLDDLHGWVVGRGGGLAITVDGGKTWQEHEVPGGGDLVQVQFVTLETGWTRPLYGDVVKTTDGGKTWLRQHADISGSKCIVDIQFLDENVGFLLAHPETGRSQVARTVDGGKKWQVIGTHGVGLAALSFVDANHGWVVGPAGCVFRYDLGPLSAAAE